MPQKRNPVPFEHVRILASRAMMEAQAVLGSLHNTPYSDINDSEDDLQPRIYEAFDCAQRSLHLAAGALSEAEIRVERMAECAEKNFLTVTELADTLVRMSDLSFRTAHEIVSKAVKVLKGVYDREKMVSAVEAIFPEVTGQEIRFNTSVLKQALDAKYFVEIRSVIGGTALAVLEPEIRKSEEILHEDRSWLEERLNHLARASERTQQESENLIASLETDYARDERGH